MKKFEYQTIIVDNKSSFLGGKVDSENLNRVLNKMGREGWELIEVVSSNKTAGETRSLVCVFKRELV